MTPIEQLERRITRLEAAIKYDPSNWITVKEAAELAGVTVKTVYAYIQDKKFEVRDKGKNFISKLSVIEYLNSKQ